MIESEIGVNQEINPINTRGAGGSGNGRESNSHEYSIGINEQLALAVIRLQQSMDQVVNRLDALETTLSRQTQVIILIEVRPLVSLISNCFIILLPFFPFSNEVENAFQ